MEALTFDNPKYIDAKIHGGWVGPNIKPYLHYFAYNKKEDILYIPRGEIHPLKRRLKKENIQHSIVDRTLRFKSKKWEFYGEERDYQIEARKDMITYPVGVLEAATGSGKTFMAIKMIQHRGQPTLILVHTKELLYQWQEAISGLMKIDCGLIGDGKFNVKDITVGIVNTVNNNTEKLKDKFGHIIIDECHRCPSTMFTTTLGQFPAKYYLGLSATAFRRDRLTKVIYAFIGPKKHAVSKKHLYETGAVLKPDIIRINTSYRYNFRGDYSKMLSDLTRNDIRNDLIADTIIKDIKQFDSPILIVSDRVHHCEKIQSLLYDNNIDSEVLTAGVSAKNRKGIIEDVRDGYCKVLISTIQLIGEGFDAPNLHGLFIITPVKFDGRVTQVIGRVLRPEKDKTPRVYDFRDRDIQTLLKSGQSRDRLYKREWGA